MTPLLQDLIPSWLQIYMSEATAVLLGPGDAFQADRAESDLDDPDFGAAALVDDATGGGGRTDGGSEGSGSEGGGDVEAWPDDEKDEDVAPCPELRHYRSRSLFWAARPRRQAQAETGLDHVR